LPIKSTLLFILCIVILCWRHPHSEQHVPVSTPETAKKVIKITPPQKTLPLSQQIETLIRLKPTNMTMALLAISTNAIKLSAQIDTTNTKTANRFLDAIKHTIPNIKQYRWQLKPDKQGLAHIDLVIKLKSNTFENQKNLNNLKNLSIHTQLSQFQSLNPSMGLLIQEQSLTHACHLTLWSSYAYALNLIHYIEKNSGNLCASVQLKKLGFAPYL